MSDGHIAITDAIERSKGMAVCAYLTGGYPTPDTFVETLHSVSRSADVVEIGIPFTDPMADGLTIQRSSRTALDNGVTLQSIFEMLGSVQLEAPHLLMGYYNPFLAVGLEFLVEEMVRCGTSALIVPDLPLEESSDLRFLLEASGLGLVQLIAPTTPSERVERLASASRGFVYAVATKGVTGGATTFDLATLNYLDRVKASSTLPVLAGFGVRTSLQVAELSGHVDGVVVGSALIDAIDNHEDPGEALNGLRVQ